MAFALDTAAQDLLFREAHTVNNFTDEPVTDGQIQEIYDLVKYGPTSMNGQPMRVVLVRTPEARERLVGHMVDSNKTKTAAAPLTAILALDTRFHENLSTLFPHAHDALEIWAPEDFRIAHGRFNVGLQAGYFIIGIRAAGLAAGPMTGYDPEGINKDFFSDGKHIVLAVVNIGKPGKRAWHDRGPRLDYDQVVTTV
ncbi:malonic semialdehyde reductase [Streptomyces sp. NBC_01304]|uniref:malonic semialdehyde reductase n=1 Tax=Streptomyces sp. NBC_01304 TaxID=2903818 RepID=UPI002E135416|nr:malonic semialdehyde reductase [Streptomyces sp. NBC_01304]